MRYLYGVALVAGVASAVEPGQNATLAKAGGDPLFAGFVCCALGTAIFALALLAARRPAPPARDAARAPWWAWVGGALGGIVVLAQLVVARRIGAAPFLATVVTAGVAASILLDHRGLVGFEVRRASRLRVAGAALMVAGVALVAAS